MKDWITKEEFDEELENLVLLNAESLLDIPGAYEIFANHFRQSIEDMLSCIKCGNGPRLCYQVYSDYCEKCYYGE